MGAGGSPEARRALPEVAAARGLQVRCLLCQFECLHCPRGAHQGSSSVACLSAVSPDLADNEDSMPPNRVMPAMRGAWRAGTPRCRLHELARHARAAGAANRLQGRANAGRAGAQEQGDAKTTPSNGTPGYGSNETDPGQLGKAAGAAAPLGGLVANGAAVHPALGHEHGSNGSYGQALERGGQALERPGRSLERGQALERGPRLDSGGSAHRLELLQGHGLGQGLGQGLRSGGFGQPLDLAAAGGWTAGAGSRCTANAARAWCRASQWAAAAARGTR